MTTNYIFVTGGVVSSLGKGIAAASLAAILEARGLNVTIMKLDPYINVDPGTMHGAWIHVDIRVQLHDGHVQTTGFENGCEGGCGNAFTQRGNDPAGHKNIIRCHAEPESLGLKTVE